MTGHLWKEVIWPAAVATSCVWPGIICTAVDELLTWSSRKLNQVNAKAHTVAVLTLILPPTLVTMTTATMRAIGREDQW